MRPAPCLPGLFDQGAPRETKRVNVPRTSVEAYQRTHAETRIATVLSELNSYSIKYCHPPTSAELTQWRHYHSRYSTDDLLYIRRGLSDALAKGLVEHGPSRRCAVSGTQALTWRVRSR